MIRRFALATLISLLPLAPALAEPPASQATTDEAQTDQSRFLRFTGDSKNGGKLEDAIGRP